MPRVFDFCGSFLVLNVFLLENFHGYNTLRQVIDNVRAWLHNGQPRVHDIQKLKN